MCLRCKGLRALTAFGVLAVLGTVAPAARAGDMTAQNKATFQKFVDQVLNQGDMAAFDQMTTPGFVEHEQMPPDMPEGREGCKAFFTMIRTAFPDLKVTVDEMMAQGDKVMAFETWTGTNQGEFMGMPATGKSVTFQCVDMVRMENGKAAEHWGVTDRLGMMQQLHPEMMSMGANGMGMMHKGMLHEEMQGGMHKDMPKTDSKSGN